MSDSNTNETSRDFKERLIYDKLSFYYLSLPILVMGNLLGSLLLGALLIGKTDLSMIVLWITLHSVLFAYQIYHYFQFKSISEENKLKQAHIWLDKYYTNVLLNGIIWGSSAFLLFPDSDFAYQLIIMIFLFAVGFSSMGILASKTDLLLTYVLVVYGPLIGKLIMLNKPIYLNLFFAVTALVLLMIIIANYYGKIINKSLDTRQHFIAIKQSHEKLKERFFSLFERAPVGIFYYNENLELQDVNTFFMHMNKINSKDELLGLNLHAIHNPQVLKVYEEVFDGKSGKYRGPYEALHAKNLYVNLSTVPMLDPEGNVAGGIAIVNDITNEVTAKEEMVRNAYYDMLTKIPNRTLLMDKLTAYTEQKRDQNDTGALLFISIDNFKVINETYGHHIGDHLLKQVAQRLSTFAGTNEIFARISGKNFVIFIPSLDTDSKRAKELIRNYVENLNKYLNQPFEIASEAYGIRFSIGVVPLNYQDAISPYELIKRAEIAMYEAKKSDKNYLFYEHTMQSDTQELFDFGKDIKRALKNNEITVSYQPQLRLDNQALFGAEALVRWKHPTKGFISPNLFIPVAENSGIVIELEEYIFDKVFRAVSQIADMHNGNFPLDHIAINISALHFLQPNFIEKFTLMLHQHGIRPEWIEIELPENTIMKHTQAIIERVKALKEYGIGFSIDDFGTGYTSISKLQELPADTIKIDQSFMQNLTHNTNHALIAETIIAIGKKLDIKVVAEGVESKEVLTKLRQMGCDYYQGHVAYKPLPLTHFIRFIQEKTNTDPLIATPV